MFKWHLKVEYDNNSVDVKLIANSLDKAIALVKDTLKIKHTPSITAQRID